MAKAKYLTKETFKKFDIGSLVYMKTNESYYGAEVFEIEHVKKIGKEEVFAVFGREQGRILVVTKKDVVDYWEIESAKDKGELI